MLTANQESETAIYAFLKSQERLIDTRDAVAASQRSVEIVTLQYREGATDFNRVFNLQTLLVQDQDRPAYVVGRAAHVLILEGRDVYEQTYAFGGPINPKTGQPFGSRTKAFQDWADAQGKPVLDDDQAALIESLCASVQAHQPPAPARTVPDGSYQRIDRGDDERLCAQEVLLAQLGD